MAHAASQKARGISAGLLSADISASVLSGESLPPVQTCHRTRDDSAGRVFVLRSHPATDPLAGWQKALARDFFCVLCALCGQELLTQSSQRKPQRTQRKPELNTPTPCGWRVSLDRLHLKYARDPAEKSAAVCFRRQHDLDAGQW